MSWFKRKEQRSVTENIVNPCPAPPQPEHPELLQNFMGVKKFDPMMLSAFFAAVNLVSNSIALMSWLFKDDEDNLLRKSHYLYHLFDDSEISRFNLVKNVIQDIFLYGNGFIFIERDDVTGTPKTLHYSPARDTAMWIEEFGYTVMYQNPRFSLKPDNGDNYLHFFMNTDNGFYGRPIRKNAYKTIELAGYTEESFLQFEQSGGRLYGILTTNNTAPQVGTRDKNMQELKQTWNEQRRQANGTGTIFMPADLKFQQLSTSAKDAAMIESREYNITDIARFLANINPVLLGDLRHNVYGSLAEAQKEFIIHSLSPLVVMWEEECNRKLIMPSKRNLQYVDLDENSILATDLKSQSDYYTSLVTNGILTINEARKQLGYCNMDGGDDLIIPFSDVSQNKVNQDAPEAEDKNKEDENNEQEEDK